MGSPSANTRTLPTNVQVSQSCGITRFPVSAAVASRCVPSRRGRFHDRIPKGAGRHAESAPSAPLVTAAQAILHFAAPPSAKSQCPPGIRPALSAPVASTCLLLRNPPPQETTTHPSAPFSSGKSRSAEPSPHRQLGARPRTPVPARSRPQHFSGTLPGASAAPEPPAADSQSPHVAQALLPVLFSSFFSAPSVSLRSDLFSFSVYSVLFLCDLCVNSSSSRFSKLLRRLQFHRLLNRHPGSLPPALRMPRIMLLIRPDNLLHQIVPDHVFVAKLHRADSRNSPANFHGLDQPALLPARQVNLRDVPGNHGLRIESQPRQKHLHLLAGGVLRFVQNHERIVQRPPAHKRQRRNLDDSLLQKPLQLVRIQHVVQRVIQRPHVRINLLLQRPRQKSQSLPRLHRRPRQNNSVHLLGQQRAHRHRHRQISFPRAPRANPERHIVRFNLFHVLPLRRGLRRNHFLAKRPRSSMLKHPPRRFVRL